MHQLPAALTPDTNDGVPLAAWLFSYKCKPSNPNIATNMQAVTVLIVRRENRGTWKLRPDDRLARFAGDCVFV
jgi:hypothetical protein